MNSMSAAGQQARPDTGQQGPQATVDAKQPVGQVIPLRPPRHWHDPLKLIQEDAPDTSLRIVLWTVAVLVLILLVWAGFGEIDIIASADGKLVPQTLVKIVQPAESGVVKELLVQEGDSVQAGQVLGRLDTTIARAEGAGVASDLAIQRLQVRRIESELAGQPMAFKAGDDPQLTAQVQSQYSAHRKAFLDSLAQEQSILAKATHERKSAAQTLNKLEQTLPIYAKAAEAYGWLEKEGFYGGLATAEKQREALEKVKDLDADDPVMTYVARNLEPYRGFHSFMRALPQLLARQPACEVVIVGGDVSYSSKPQGAASWRAKLLGELNLDLERVHFLGKIPYAAYRRLLQVSAVHVYLTYPVVLSWSMLKAMACGCVLVASDTAPVREVIREGENGWLVDVFDAEAIAARVE